MRTPELKKIILRMSGKSEFYGYEIHKKLEEKQIKIGIGRLYSVLGEMKDEGLLVDRWEESRSGPKRRIYKIGQRGVKERDKILMDAIRTVHEFYTEYLMTLPPEHSVFNKISEILTKGLSQKSTIGYVATKFTGPLKKIIGQLRNDIEEGKVYAIAEKASEEDLGVTNVLVIEGTFEDLPIKNEFLDLLVVTGNLRGDSLEEYFSEWQRVLSKNGVLAIVTPTTTIATYEDPLEIGEFVEQREHPRTEDSNLLSQEIIQSKMTHFFKETEEHRVVHITVLLGRGTIQKNV
ncbi:MAG: helix-turn-helix transcriptional regulator [Candidatus Thorarchaeota archaeon]